MKINWAGIFIGIVLLVIITLAISIILSSFRNIPQQYCEDMRGKYITYECQEIPFSNSPCSELKTGRYCEFPDGTSLSEEEIWAKFKVKFNSTMNGLI